MPEPLTFFAVMTLLISAMIGGRALGRWLARRSRGTNAPKPPEGSESREATALPPFIHDLGEEGGILGEFPMVSSRPDIVHGVRLSGVYDFQRLAEGVEIPLRRAREQLFFRWRQSLQMQEWAIQVSKEIAETLARSDDERRQLTLDALQVISAHMDDIEQRSPQNR